MGFFSGLKKMFDTGGVKVALDAPKTFSWDDGGIPVTVTLTGGDEARTVTALEFEFEDEPDGGGSPGLGSRNRERDRSRISTRSQFRMLFTHEGPFELGAGEVKTFELTVPITTEQNPGSGVAEAVIGAVLGGTLNFGAAWYKLSVGAPVEGAKAVRTTSQRLKASGQMRVTGGTGR
ncbi:MAG TPA: hypothetical protein PK781_05775 [Terrimesophilobacter sp.]|nr:hypothetical protein [Terrimesophilobacter sp.]HRP99950.1 hypothetical protein [Terrimesophilobacter sp.]